MIMRATQKNMISGADTSVWPGIEPGEVRSAVGPAEARERHQPGGEPGVEHVVVLPHGAAAAGHDVDVVTTYA